jgi:hypothetical protein
LLWCWLAPGTYITLLSWFTVSFDARRRLFGTIPSSLVLVQYIRASTVRCTPVIPLSFQSKNKTTRDKRRRASLCHLLFAPVCIWRQICDLEVCSRTRTPWFKKCRLSSPISHTISSERMMLLNEQ